MIITRPCGCFFRGREFFECEQHREPDEEIMLNLYYLNGDDPDGESRSLMVVAPSPEAAHRMFLYHWFEFDEPECFAGPVIKDRPPKPAECLLIYEVNYDPDTPGALSWGREAEIVAYVDP